MNLSPFKLERYFAKYEFNTEFLLCSSDCEAMSIADLLALEEGAAEKFQQTWLGYTESQGHPALRKEIAKIYETIQPDEILVHTGAEEVIFLFMLAVLKEGDHIVVHAPHYQSLSEIAIGMGCEVSLWQAHEENGWALDLDELRQLIRPATKAIIINTPHNPTGFLMSKPNFEALNGIVKENDLFLFCDEVYRESEYDPEQRLPAGCDMGEHAFSLCVTSKTYGLAGLRIGWVATKNRKIYETMASLKDYTTICNSAPSEFLAEVALRNRQKLVARNVGIIKSNLEIVDDLFARHSDLFQWVRPSAGSMGFPKLLKGNAEEFCNDLAKTAGVLLLPGTLYDLPGNHFRIGLGRKNLPQAVVRLEEHLANRKS